MLRTVGRRGDGPGEFQQPWAVSCFDPDSVAVLEPFRISVGSLTRPPMRSFALNASGDDRWIEPVARVSPERFLLRRRPRAPRVEVGSYRDTVDLLIGNPAGNDTTRVVNLGRMPGGEYVRVRLKGRSTTAVHPFARELLVGVADRRVYVMDTGTPDLEVIEDGGETIRRVRFETAGRAVTPEIRRRLEARQREAARIPAQREITEQLIAQTRVPTSTPRFDRMVVSRDGGAWLREFVFEGEAEANWLQLDAALRPVVRWRLPSSARLIAASKEQVLIVQATDEGTSVAVYQLPGTAERAGARRERR